MTSPEETVEAAAGEFPPRDIPTLFFDSVTSASWSRGVLSCYLSKSHPDIHAHGKNEPVIFAQLVMPIDTFVTTAVFFGYILDKLKAGDLVNDEQIEAIRKSLLG